MCEVEEGWVQPAERGTPAQKCFLLEFLELRPLLAQKEYSTSAGRKDAEAEWENLSQSLNNIRGGAQKTTAQWMKYWDDQRTAVKKRAARVRNHLAGTGGGRPLDLLTDYDRRVLGLMGGWTRVVGFTSVIDPLEINPIGRGVTPGHEQRRTLGVRRSDNGLLYRSGMPHSSPVTTERPSTASANRWGGPSTASANNRWGGPSTASADRWGGPSTAHANWQRGPSTANVGWGGPSRNDQDLAVPSHVSHSGIANQNGWEIVPPHILHSSSENESPLNNRDIPHSSEANQSLTDDDGWESVPPHLLSPQPKIPHSSVANQSLTDDEGWESVPSHLLSPQPNLLKRKPLGDVTSNRKVIISENYSKTFKDGQENELPQGPAVAASGLTNSAGARRPAVRVSGLMRPAAVRPPLRVGATGKPQSSSSASATEVSSDAEQANCAVGATGKPQSSSSASATEVSSDAEQANCAVTCFSMPSHDNVSSAYSGPDTAVIVSRHGRKVKPRVRYSP